MAKNITKKNLEKLKIYLKEQSKLNDPKHNTKQIKKPSTKPQAN